MSRIYINLGTNKIQKTEYETFILDNVTMNNKDLN
jgi:hypothetical protein